MGRVIAVVVLASMLAGGCAPALSRVRVRLGAGVVQVTTRTAAAGPAAARGIQASPQDPSPSAQEASPAALRTGAAKIPVGTKVNVKMRSGPDLKGTLREAGTTGIVLQKPAAKAASKTARESGSQATIETVAVPYEAMRSIERDASMGTAKKAALIAAVNAAAGMAVYQVQKGPATDGSVPAGG